MATLKKSSWHSMLYKSFYGTNDLPKSICPYFWKLLFAILMCIPCYPSVIFNYFDKYRDTHWVYGLLLNLIFFGVGVNYFTPETIKQHSILYLYGLGLFTIFMIMLFVTAIVYFIIGLVKLLRYFNTLFTRNNDIKPITYKHKKERKPNVISLWWDSIKNKYCAKIDWE